jgi:hypothetical protein
MAFVLGISGCSSLKMNPSLFSNQNVDPEAQVYLEDFILGLKEANQLDDFKQALSHLKIKFVDTVRTEDGILPLARGRCLLKDDLISLDKEFWSHLPEDKRQLTLDHEIGHCLLKRVHRNIFDPAHGMGMSIMSSVDMDMPDYNLEKKRLRQELFTKKFYGSLIILTDLTENQSEMFNRAYSFSEHRYEHELNGDLELSQELKNFIIYYKDKLQRMIYK